MSGLKKKEKEVLLFIKEYALTKGYLPTVREISEGVHLKSTSSIAWYMITLEKKGYIKREGWRYTVKGLRYVADDLEM